MEISEVMIVEHLQYIKENCEKMKGVSIKYISSKDTPWIYSSLCGEIDSLIKEYNWVIPSINKFLENQDFSFRLEEVKIIGVDFKEMSEENKYPTVDKKLMKISLECNRILSILKNIATSTKEMKNRYDDLKKEIKNLDKKLPKLVIRDLYEAIEEFELNKSLGAVLICGRLTVFHLDLIKGDINQKINELKSKGFLMEKGAPEFVLKADKKVRELFSHDINYFPSPSETISFLGDTIKLVKIINEYQEKITKPDKNNIVEALKSVLETGKK